MFFITIVALLLAAALCFWRGRKRTASTCLVLGILLVIGTGTGPITGHMLRNLQSGFETEDSASVIWAPRSLIVLLGMGTVTLPSGRDEVGPLAYGRIAKAVEAYELCSAAGSRCQVLLTGGDKFRQGVIEAEVYAAQLDRMGIPRRDMLLETKSQNTWENALYARQMIDVVRPEQVYLVTSGVHMRRALLYFKHFGLSPAPIRSDYLLPWDTIEPMVFNISLADLAVTEYQGLLRYRVYNTLGKNPPPVAPYVPPSSRP